jgi:hypothetical protein
MQGVARLARHRDLARPVGVLELAVAPTYASQFPAVALQALDDLRDLH